MVTSTITLNTIKRRNIKSIGTLRQVLRITNLYPILKKAKQKKQTAYFKVDKLIINGQIYRGEETTNLSYYGLIMDTRNSGN